MQERLCFGQRRVPTVLVLVLLIVTQQVCAGPVMPRGESSDPLSRLQRKSEGTLKRTARMTPLWRIMNSKPSGAYCQKDYECSTGFCRAGHCAKMHRTASDSVTY